MRGLWGSFGEEGSARGFRGEVEEGRWKAMTGIGRGDGGWVRCIWQSMVRRHVD